MLNKPTKTQIIKEELKRFMRVPFCLMDLLAPLLVIIVVMLIMWLGK
jgi:hypothetical protein